MSSVGAEVGTRGGRRRLEGVFGQLEDGSFFELFGSRLTGQVEGAILIVARVWIEEDLPFTLTEEGGFDTL